LIFFFSPYVTNSEAFSVKCEEINVNGEQPKILEHTAQIYDDFLCVYGGVDETDRLETERDLGSFDLSKRRFECSLVMNR